MKELARYISDLRDLDLKDISSWPCRAQRLLTVGMILLTAAFCIGYIILPDQAALSESRHTEQQLKHVFSTKRQSAAQLTAYQQQLATLKHRFQASQASMPNKDQTATVLGLITQAATANGLHKTSIKPDTAVRENFYTKQPVQMVMTGTFLQFAQFVSDTAGLPWLVTIDPIDISLHKPEMVDSGHTSTGPLRMRITVNIFHNADDQKLVAGSGETSS